MTWGRRAAVACPASRLGNPLHDCCADGAREHLRRDARRRPACAPAPSTPVAGVRGSSCGAGGGRRVGPFGLSGGAAAERSSRRSPRDHRHEGHEPCQHVQRTQWSPAPAMRSRHVPGTKVVILAGGRGTRLSEETHAIPKPMVRHRRAADPVAHHEALRVVRVHRLRGRLRLQGLRDQGVLHQLPSATRATSTVDLRNGCDRGPHRARAEDWRVTLADTGESTMTGGRLKRLAPDARRAVPADLRRRPLRRADRRR